MSAKEHIIVIKPDGKLRTLYSDDVAAIIAPVGKMHVQRASNVEFSARLGGWFVEFPGDGFLGVNNTIVFNIDEAASWVRREDALAAEVAYLEARL